jgi:hypothetical protein
MPGAAAMARAFFLRARVMVSERRVAQRRATLKVDIPQPADDKPKLGRVGIIAIVGFVIGMAWPRLAGVTLVPSPPVEEGEPVASAQPAPATGGGEAPSLSKAARAGQAGEARSEIDGADRVRISEPKITSCRSENGQRAEQCGSLELDGVSRARIQALAGCSGAENAHGTLSLGLELDFGSKKITELLRGKSTTLPEPAAKALIDCAKKEFASASLDGMAHEHAKYTVFYIVELLPPSALAQAGSDGAGAEPTAEEVSGASGRATVGWDVALIRDKPKDGAVVARVLRGTRVTVTGRQDDWYRIKYDAKGSEGWVFKSAIGL